MALPLMAAIGIGSSLIGAIGAGSAKRKRNEMLTDQYDEAKANLEAAQNMDIPELQKADYSSATSSAKSLIDMGENQARTGLSSSEISMLTNRALGNRPTLGGGAAPVGSLFRRLSQGQGMLELGSALADARQKGAENIAAGGGMLKGIADSKAQENLSIYGVESKRYDAIQQAAGEAFAQAQANKLGAINQDMAMNTQIAMMGAKAAGDYLGGFELKGGFGSGESFGIGKIE